MAGMGSMREGGAGAESESAEDSNSREDSSCSIREEAEDIHQYQDQRLMHKYHYFHFREEREEGLLCHNLRPFCRFHGL